MSSPNTPKDGQVETTGHVWDEDLEEFNNPLPRWWLWTFYLTIIWGVAYTIAYPAWPLISQATPGLLGYSTRAEVATEITRVETANASIEQRLVDAELTAIATDPELNQFALNAGAAVFRTNCSQCHGAGAAGVQASGYPNLLDDDWLWGGDIEAIHTTVSHGIRNDLDPDARFSEMPAFADVLSEEEIAQTADYVLSLSGQEHDAALAAAGETLFLDNCASCHGDAGEGMRDLGAPNLGDAIWLYGGSREAITSQIVAPRNGVMPPWTQRLTEAEIRAVATYVHGLGGGETLE
ncbi:MAG: cytochrome-c oxidase, cbb3-type subunit III [Rhodobacteraceae bacterium]|jgi:cytochrome c oxidase cbb3-type subunit 3|nr:cytochrome-c oxidase, cbb3-type subunit III [Paracoccaceae bacterium]